MLSHIPITIGSAVCLTWVTCWVEGCNGLGNVHSKGKMKDVQETEDEDVLLQACPSKAMTGTPKVTPTNEETEPPKE